MRPVVSSTWTRSGGAPSMAAWAGTDASPTAVTPSAAPRHEPDRDTAQSVPLSSSSSSDALSASPGTPVTPSSSSWPAW